MKPVALHTLLHICTESDSSFIACIIIGYVIIFKFNHHCCRIIRQHVNTDSYQRRHEMKKLAAAVLIILSVSGCAMSARIHDDFSEARERAARNNLPLVFMAYGQEPNTAGGVTVEINFQNVSTKTIKNIVFTLTPFDADGRQVSCEVSRKCGTDLTAVGYFRYDSGYSSRYWENVWYSRVIQYIQVNAVTITFMDGATQIVNKPEDLSKMAIAVEAWSYTHFWSGQAIGSKPASGGPPANRIPLRTEPVRTEPLK